MSNPSAKATRSRLAVLLLAAFFGAQITVFGMLFGARPAFAAGVQAECMAEGECIDMEMASGGNCDDKHCFEANSACPSGGGYCYAKWAPAKLSVKIGGAETVLDIGDYIIKLYNYGMGVAAALAATMMVVGGLYYLTSGSGSGAQKGREYIMNALIGLLILAGAWIILQTVNPDLVRFRLPKFPVVKRQFLLLCDKFEKCHPCGVEFYVTKPKDTDTQSFASGGEGTVSDADCRKYTALDASGVDTSMYDVSSACYGNSCSLLAGACGDANHHCVKQGSPDEKPDGNCVTGAGSTNNPNDDLVTRTCKNNVNYIPCMQAAGWDFTKPDDLAQQPGANQNKVTVCKQKLLDCLSRTTTGNVNAVATSNPACAPGPNYNAALCAASPLGTGGSNAVQMDAGQCISDDQCGDPACSVCQKASPTDLFGTCAAKPGAPASCTGAAPAAASAPAAATGGADPSGVTNGWYCKGCKMDGEACTSVGPSSDCCSGRCVNSRGSVVGSTANQIAGANPIGTAVCSSGEMGAPCASSNDCATGVCNTSLVAWGMCTTGRQGSPCNDNKECLQGYQCTAGQCTGNTDFSYCEKGEQCASGTCDSELHMCVPAAGFTECNDNAGCPSGQICNRSSVSVSTSSGSTVYGASGVGTTFSVRGVCTSGAPGSPCRSHGDCASVGTMSGVCVNGRCGSRSLGEACTQSVPNPCGDPNNKCVCAGFWGNKCFCMSGAEGSPCDKTADCRSPLTCVITAGGSGQRGLGVCRK